MAEARASLSDYRQSPRKMRVVADLVRGKKVEDALVTLTFTTKRASLPLQKLISSAVANAKNLSIPVENLVVKKISIDGGPILYRRRPRSRGMANPIRKRTSHINITLAEKIEKEKPSKK
ncbi:MAG: 50S ribosomal protein L22 [Minisyncoccota bacterium]